MEKAIVITPTIGNNIDELKQNINSVRNQTVNTYHLLVVDGMEHYPKIYHEITSKEEYLDVGVTMAPFNTGNNGYYGHRIMAAYAHLHDFEYTLYLDEDNWIEPNHVEGLINTISDNHYFFSHSLRNIFDKDGNFLCRDECESLGSVPSIGGYHLVDTSSYCFRTSFLIKVAQRWHKGWGADREFFQTMMEMESLKDRFGSSDQYTLNYRLGGNPNSVNKEFFLEGNKAIKQAQSKIIRLH